MAKNLYEKLGVREGGGEELAGNYVNLNHEKKFSPFHYALFFPFIIIFFFITRPKYRMSVLG